MHQLFYRALPLSQPLLFNGMKSSVNKLLAQIFKDTYSKSRTTKLMKVVGKLPMMVATDIPTFEVS